MQLVSMVRVRADNTRAHVRCLPAGKWDKARFDTIVNGITPFLRQCGYNMKKEVAFLPVSDGP
jgi:translation elongation factor EF-1alpha